MFETFEINKCSEWKKKYREQQQSKRPILVPLDETIIAHVKCVHVMWTSTNQAYDVIKLHNTPHYSLSGNDVKKLVILAELNNVDILQYESDRDYCSVGGFLKVFNIAIPPIVSPQLKELIEKCLQDPIVLKQMDNKRGNTILSVGYCSQVFLSLLSDVDTNFQGITGLNREHLTTQINKTALKDHWRKVLLGLTNFSLSLDPTLFPDNERKWVCHNVPGYESLTFAVLDSKSVLLPHVDRNNDTHEKYYHAANYFWMTQTGKRISLIGYTRQSARNFMKRYKLRNNQFMTCLKKHS